MRKSFTLLFAASFLLGNVCLMSTAYAAEKPVAKVTTHSSHGGSLSCTEHSCSADSSKMKSKHTRKGARHSSCIGEHCLTKAAPADAAAVTSTKVISAPVIPLYLLQQILLAIGPTQPPMADDSVIKSTPLRTIVLRQ